MLKIKNAEIQHIRYFKYPDLGFDAKNYFYLILTTCSTRIGPKIKSAQNLLEFGTFDISYMPISILTQKMIFYQIFTNCQAQIGSKMKNAQNLLRFGSVNISKMPISTLMSNISFIKYLPPAKPKFVPKLKVPRIY